MLIILPRKQVLPCLIASVEHLRRGQASLLIDAHYSGTLPHTERSAQLA